MGEDAVESPKEMLGKEGEVYKLSIDTEPSGRNNLGCEGHLSVFVVVGREEGPFSAPKALEAPMGELGPEPGALLVGVESISSRALFLYGVMMFPSLLLSIGLLLLSATFCFSLDRTFRLGSEAVFLKGKSSLLSMGDGRRYWQVGDVPPRGGELWSSDVW